MKNKSDRRKELEKELAFLKNMKIKVFSGSCLKGCVNKKTFMDRIENKKGS